MSPSPPHRLETEHDASSLLSSLGTTPSPPRWSRADDKEGKEGETEDSEEESDDDYMHFTMNTDYYGQGEYDSDYID